MTSNWGWGRRAEMPVSAGSRKEGEASEEKVWRPSPGEESVEMAVRGPGHLSALRDRGALSTVCL